MDSLTTESDHLLRKRANKKMAALLDAEQVNWLLETKLDALAKSPDEMQTTEGGEKLSDVISRVKEELAGMVEDDAKKEAAERERNELEQLLQQLRAKVMAENSVSFRKETLLQEIFYQPLAN